MKRRLPATVFIIFMGALTSACFGPEQKTKLICQAGVSIEVTISVVNSHGGKMGSSTIAPTDAAGVCEKMAEAVKETGLKVDRFSPTVLVITGTDRVKMVYIHNSREPFVSPLVQESVGGS